VSEAALSCLAELFRDAEAMIRFSCPNCGAKMKAKEEDRGSSIRCSQCRTKVKLPAADDDAAGAVEDTPRGKRRRSRAIGKPIAALPAAPSVGGRIGKLLSEMPIMSKVVVGGTLAAAIAGCALWLLGTAASEGEAGFPVGKVGLLLLIGGAIGFLGALYGVLSSCPNCHTWFGRGEKEKTHEARVYYLTPSGERLEPLSDKDDEDGVLEGTRYLRSVARTHYACKWCKHQWTAEVAEEYQKDRLRVHRE
jgi:hypothetical protein